MVSLRYTAAAVLLQSASFVLVHGHDETVTEDMGDMAMSHGDSSMDASLEQEPDYYAMDSYSGLSSHTTLLAAHVGLMVLAWFFVLPVGVMFSISRSRYTLPVQFLFLVVNGIGVLLATIYNVKTPDLYENNAHHKIGWIATWVMAAQVVMGLLFLYSGRTTKHEIQSLDERAGFLPVSVENMAQHDMSPYHDYRWPAESGSATARSSTTLNSPRDISPMNAHRLSKAETAGDDLDNDGDEDEEEGLAMPTPTFAPQQGSRFRIKAMDTFLAKRVPGLLSRRLLRAVEIGYEVVDRTILILGFIALMSGAVTYAGWMRGSNIFNGLAHFVKGGIFFWYGLLTLGRWMGCWSSWGWSWNAKPSRSELGQSTRQPFSLAPRRTRSKWSGMMRMPSAEFTESFVIWLYGTTNVFLEHLAAWGGEWTAQDLEHVSISIMFFGGGLLGMLIESETIRSWLNTTVESLPARDEFGRDKSAVSRQKPRTYSYSLNPMPALIIFLLGIMMSSHHQNSMVSTMVHKQWGTLLSGFSLARMVTYIIMYLSPPTSVYPSRPPSELVASFCLISGGLVFMASTRDIIRTMEDHDLMAMFVFTVVMGFTAFLMAWEVIVISLKGWATRREMKEAVPY